jgi:hypothetical protein
MDVPSVEQQLAEITWCDVELRGISWADEGRDLILALRLPPSKRNELRERVLIAHWATQFTARLSFAERTGGYLLTWDAAFDRDSSGQWAVSFDFGSAGELSFRCSGFELVDRV